MLRTDTKSLRAVHEAYMCLEVELSAKHPVTFSTICLTAVHSSVFTQGLAMGERLATLLAGPPLFTG